MDSPPRMARTRWPRAWCKHRTAENYSPARPIVVRNSRHALYGASALLYGASLWTQAAWAQPPDPESTPIRVDVNVVNILCTVTDKRGALITDLKQQDFEIRENGRKQEIRYFTRDTDLPLTVAMLMDVSGSAREAIAAEREAAGRFFDAVIRPTDHALLLGFSSTLVLWQDFTSSTPRLRSSLAQLHAVPFHGLPHDGGPMPGTLLYDAVYQTSMGKLKDVPGRK